MFDSVPWNAFSEEFYESATVKEKIAKDYCIFLAEIASEIIVAIRRGNTLFLAGNGGSAADAAHIQGELVHRFTRDRKAVKCVTLLDNTALLTAISNDWGYDQIFKRQVEAWVKPGDIVLCFTTSGKSANILKALEQAKAVGGITIVFTGNCPETIPYADHVFNVPSSSTARIQEAHLTAGHILCGLIERFCKL